MSSRPEADGLSAITVTYNSESHAPELVTNLRRLLPAAELVVVDNASLDRTREVVRQHPGSARLVETDANLGFGRAANLGAAAARGRWLLFMNPDVRLGALAVPAEAPTGFGLAAGSLSGQAGARASTFAETTPAEDWVQNVVGRFLPPALARWVPPRRRSPVAWVSGALFLTSAADFATAGGFDERYFMYFEDRDLGARYRRYGLPIRTIEDLRGRHHAGTSSHGGIDPERQAWLLLSWFEYVGIWRGQAAADQVAGRTLRALELAAVAGDRAGTARRVREKARQVREVASQVISPRREPFFSEHGFYPHARTAVARWRREARA